MFTLIFFLLLDKLIQVCKAHLDAPFLKPFLNLLLPLDHFCLVSLLQHLPLLGVDIITPWTPVSLYIGGFGVVNLLGDHKLTPGPFPFFVDPFGLFLEPFVLFRGVTLHDLLYLFHPAGTCRCFWYILVLAGVCKLEVVS